MTTVKSIMSKKVFSLSPEMPLSEGAKVLVEHNFDGAPVVDKENKLVGILTEYDLISKESIIHLPTFQTILQNLEIFKRDRSQFQKEVQEVAELKVKDVMNSDPLTLPEDATFEEAVKVFREHHRVNPIPVIDEDRKVVGVISRYDILKPLHVLSDL
ncbi:hypothetical protein A3B18_00355 [Candidatus Giovannonibacteria bacterium RIFCSPLOWO2_01_FULL_46_13]|uniref:CBS domain-containing protein n=1 Tax=Candidatus Giovannonibacteria bacterium RIFCSPLOWO2_01_FULL_46_13 TaxID=1798352 RepID=A0A1F5X441_9BACT|nr:MAG: hypothetical protein A3B18_00355 [Candidatus Giovannonibacteria bacterium RIFCSPLOWO2_01_FULL_46_13]